MSRAGVVLAVAVLTGLSGCKLPHAGTEAPAELAPPLLVGPEAVGKAPAPELAPKEAAQACLRTAQEYEKNGQVEAAIGLYAKARSLDPSLTSKAGRRLAVLYDQVGDFTKASAEYEVLLKASPKDPDLLNDVGYSYYCRGDWANAEAHLTRAVKIAPDHKHANMHLGLVLAVQGKYDEAFRVFCGVVRPPEAHCNLAFVLAAAGKAEEAKEQYRKALALDPHLRVAHGGLATLENPAAARDRAAAAAARKDEPYDPAEAAARIPTIAELEARLKKAAGEDLEAPVIGPEVGAVKKDEERN